MTSTLKFTAITFLVLSCLKATAKADNFIVQAIEGVRLGNGSISGPPVPLVFSPGFRPNHNFVLSLPPSLTQSLIKKEHQRPWAQPYVDKVNTKYRITLTAPCFCKQCRRGVFGLRSCSRCYWDKKQLQLTMTIPWEDVKQLPKFDYPRLVPRNGSEYLPFVEVWKRFVTAHDKSGKTFGSRLKLTSVPDYWTSRRDIDGERIGDDDQIPAAAAALWLEYVAVSPKTYLNTMQLQYGVELGRTRAAIDLTPGVRMQVDLAAEYYEPPGPVHNGTLNLDITRHYQGGPPYFAFDSHLDYISSGSGSLSDPTLSPSTANLLAGRFGLQAYKHPQRFYRLVYPQKYMGKNPSEPNRVNNAFVIVGHSDRQKLDLKSLTVGWEEKDPILQTFSWEQDGGAIGYHVFAFNGRSVVSLQASSKCHGSLHHLPIGESFQHQRDKLGNHDTYTLELEVEGQSELLPLKASEWGATGGTQSSMTLHRQFRDRVYPVRFVRTGDVAVDRQIYDLPILKGDVIR